MSPSDASHDAAELPAEHRTHIRFNCSRRRKAAYTRAAQARGLGLVDWLLEQADLGLGFDPEGEWPDAFHERTRGRGKAD